MYPRQSTMLKAFGILVIFLSVFSLSYGQENNDTSVATTSEDNDSSNSPGFITSVLLLPFNIISTLASPITGPVGLSVSSVYSLVSSIFSLVGSILGLVALPLRIVGSILFAVATILSYIIRPLFSNSTGIASILLELLSNVSALSRRRRSIMDSVMGMMWSALPFQYHLAHYIYVLITSPLSFIYYIVMWPYHFIFGCDDYQAETAVSSTSASFADLTMIPTILDNALTFLSGSTKASIVNLMMALWRFVDTTVLPIADKFLVSMLDWSIIPEDIQKYMKTIHDGYTMLRFLGLL